ncbi:hypothetical protein CLAFUW4_12806 [Fulvia fulva]|uniref:Uncharacterized protein n=1 Tax=Passalora fulva TaxID=5499 RepID=A0A9Q8PIK4_PASFU|nr:uncharacterized protein CLAFUR5_12674 [Fulvia fulva]KAK4611490.1 hypothetical protein CLAFUR4_12810 [Fulvia fulva]KAK4612895.1 hypothetical protein CLAFUR0_12816 [Fulvia fulva]UJO23324.1 hypothetical protein CLAFUR5_12674 [Fulvia fulva]WPV21281.1 hypothetical protein CLAFUW4_12806 [Fulvia fulva]WPV36438.1 hypothetical protein CLAFUW7_12814 [Fulvia fulva]
MYQEYIQHTKLKELLSLSEQNLALQRKITKEAEARLARIRNENQNQRDMSADMGITATSSKDKERSEA